MNAYAGVIEGFYGIPLWDRGSRLSYPSWLREHGFSFYIYAPKNDVFLRKQWSDDWPESERRLPYSLEGLWHIPLCKTSRMPSKTLLLTLLSIVSLPCPIGSGLHAA